MNISKFNEKIEELIQGQYLGLNGIEDFNRDKSAIFRGLVSNMFKRTLNMFAYENLPETLSARTIEKLLQSSGTALLVKVSEDEIKNPKAKAGYYALPCKAGGELNADYLPTTAIAVSPWLGLSKEYDLEKGEAVLLWNDSLMEGLRGLFSLYASELTDNIQTLHFQEVHSRILTILKASDDDEKKDALDFLRDFENGKFASLMSDNFIETLNNNRVEPFLHSSASSIKETLEARQWLLAHWNIELGLNDNYNMKRESLNENEIEANSDTLTPLLDDMYKRRVEGLDRFNRIFGQNARVDFSSSWKRVHKREENAQRQEDAELAIIENQAEGKETSNDEQ